MVHVQSDLVLRCSRQIDRVHTVLFEILDDLMKCSLTVALALLVFVNHKAPETVSVNRILILGVQGEHTEADNLIFSVWFIFLVQYLLLLTYSPPETPDPAQDKRFISVPSLPTRTSYLINIPGSSYIVEYVE